MPFARIEPMSLLREARPITICAVPAVSCFSCLIMMNIELIIFLFILIGMNGKKSSFPSIDEELFMKSQHSSMINGLHGRFPMYGPVVRYCSIISNLFISALEFCLTKLP